MPRKNKLTKRPKVYYNSSKTYRHCNRVIAFMDPDGVLFVQCRKCGAWVKLNRDEEA